MRKIPIYLFTSLVLGGCVHYSAYDNFLRDTKLRRDFALKHEELSPEVRQAIVEGKILPGMNQSLIKMLFGEPDETYLSETGMFEMWYYENFAFGFDKDGNIVKIFEPKDMRFIKKKTRR